MSFIQFENTSVSLSENGLTTEGIYYSYLNGYMKKHTGRHFINVKDFLAAKTVRDRSKKLMFAFILIATAFVFAYNYIIDKVKGFFELESVFDIPDKIDEATGFLEKLQSPLFVIIVLAVTAAMMAAYVLLAKYIFSNRKYIELTYIGGTIRVRCGKAKAEAVKGFVESANGMKNKSG